MKDWCFSYAFEVVTKLAVTLNAIQKNLLSFIRVKNLRTIVLISEDNNFR